MTAVQQPIACPVCGSAAVARHVYGMPTAEYAREVEGDPDFVLMGCLIVPDAVATRCRECGRTEPLQPEQP